MADLRFLLPSIIALLVLACGPVEAADAPCRLVDAPTAGSLTFRRYHVESQIFDGGGVTQRVFLGLNRYITAGLSYSGANIIGSQRVSWQPHVGIQFRVRVVEETVHNPALSLGFDSQGEGPYLWGSERNRFRNKSRGAYLVISRNYRFFGDLGFHGGVNYSLENDDGDEDPSFWAGFDKGLGEQFDLCGEYDFATNDNEHNRMTANRGYLNAAVKWHFGKAFALELDIRNILRNPRKDSGGIVIDKPQPSRELRFSYAGTF